MNEDALGARIRDAVVTIAVPAYPRAAVLARCAATMPSPAARRRIPAVVALATTLVAFAIAASAAAGGSFAVQDKVVEFFDKVGIHVRGARAIEGRTVTLAEARAKAPFAVIVPPHARLLKTNLTITPSGLTIVALTLGYANRPPVELSESLAEDATRTVVMGGARVVDANGRVRDYHVVRWQVEKTELAVSTTDARSHAFAERIRAETLAATAGGR
jgi:hypothetical protein